MQGLSPLANTVTLKCLAAEARGPVFCVLLRDGEKSPLRNAVVSYLQIFIRILNSLFTLLSCFPLSLTICSTRVVLCCRHGFLAPAVSDT